MCLMLAQCATFYRYVAMGAAHRIVIPEGTYGDLMMRFDSSASIEHEV